MSQVTILIFHHVQMAKKSLFLFSPTFSSVHSLVMELEAGRVRCFLCFFVGRHVDQMSLRPMSHFFSVWWETLSCFYICMKSIPNQNPTPQKMIISEYLCRNLYVGVREYFVMHCEILRDGNACKDHTLQCEYVDITRCVSRVAVFPWQFFTKQKLFLSNLDDIQPLLAPVSMTLLW